jgi:hypothetical protein
MSYTTPSASYWQARANQCAQFADEGACLARISRFAPVTIEPGFAGLGQSEAATITTMGPRSRDLVALHSALMSAGILSIRTADGLIDSDSSPTLAAIRSWATSNGFSSTGVARTSNGGLAIPAGLAAGILGGASVAKIVGAAPAASSILPTFDTASDAAASTGSSGSIPWIVGGTVAIIALTLYWTQRRR